TSAAGWCCRQPARPGRATRTTSGKWTEGRIKALSWKWNGNSDGLTRAKLLKAQGLEPWTYGLKVRSDYFYHRPPLSYLLNFQVFVALSLSVAIHHFRHYPFHWLQNGYRLPAPYDRTRPWGMGATGCLGLGVLYTIL